MKVIDDTATLLGIKKNSNVENKDGSTQRVILIVEDDTTLADALQAAFEEEGFVVYQAQNGEVGLESVKKYKPDIILLDLMMPVMDGKLMLKHLREFPEFKRLPVVILTNAGEVENMRQTMFYDNALEFLIKSNVSLNEIVERVKRLH